MTNSCNSVWKKSVSRSTRFEKSHAVDEWKMQAEPLHGVEQDREVCVKVESVELLWGQDFERT